jgi:predicted O-methyltransferase YrrM
MTTNTLSAATLEALGAAPVSPYRFTNSWFDNTARGVWDGLIPQIKPVRILEVGSFEGASTCYLIEKLGAEQALEIHCVDSWEGGVEHVEGGVDMGSVEDRFTHNIGIAKTRAHKPVNVVVHKSYSDIGLSRLLAEGQANSFDFIYIDGSHQAPDVLCDAVLGFRLLKVGGVMAFDDYLWAENLPYGKDPLRCPKAAIDAFTNLYFRKLNILSAPLYQLYIQKMAE